jgi:hypothetical protein
MKFDSVYDFGNYLTIGSFNTAKSMYQGMEDRAHIAMNSPYDFYNYISMGTLDLGNGAINPEESFSKDHWLSSIGLASILAGGAKPVVHSPKTASLQGRNLVLDKTIDKAHELTTKTNSHVNYVIGEVRGGIHVLLNEMNDNNNLAYSLNGEGVKIPFNVLDTDAVKKVLDKVFSYFSYSFIDDNTRVRIINKKYAGQIYYLSGDLAGKYPNGVKFTDDGFPDFSPYSKANLEIEGLIGDHYYDFKKANETLGLKNTPAGYTWHHVEDGKTMMLVPSDIHGEVRHTGGASLIKKGL